jgi:hypothetical protein
MTVQSSARLSLASSAAQYHWEDPFNKSLLKGYDERSVRTERRRVMVGDVAGGRRPVDFIASTDVRYMRVSRHESTLRLRRLERKVLFWKALWSSLFSFVRMGK